jgi:hypothetical protein
VIRPGQKKRSNGVLKRLFPKTLDNNYRGHWLGYWAFVIVVLSRLAIGINATVNTRFVAASADGIPLARYPTAAGDTITALFGITGFFLLLLSVFGVLVFIRYRAMIPLIFLVLLLDQVGRRVLLYFHPIIHSGVATANLGLTFVLFIFVLTIVGLALSLFPDKRQA